MRWVPGDRRMLSARATTPIKSGHAVAALVLAALVIVVALVVTPQDRLAVRHFSALVALLWGDPLVVLAAVADGVSQRKPRVGRRNCRAWIADAVGAEEDRRKARRRVVTAHGPGGDTPHSEPPERLPASWVGLRALRKSNEATVEARRRYSDDAS
jgi:hypothetical protein